MLLWELLDSGSSVSKDAANTQGRGVGQVGRLPFETRCSAITKVGKRCRGKIREGTEFCPFHDPQVSRERRRRNAAQGGRSHHRLTHLPDGYLRKLTSRRAVGNAMDRLYREVRLGVVTPEMGSVLFDILTRLMDTGLADSGEAGRGATNRFKADRLRPKLADLLTRAERRAWRQAVANAPADFLRSGGEHPNARSDRSQTTRAVAPAALSAAS